MPCTVLYLRLAPSPVLAAVLAALHAGAWAALSACAFQPGLMTLAALAAALQASTVIRRHALGLGPRAPVDVWLHPSGEAALRLGAGAPGPARVGAGTFHFPGLLVIQLRTPQGRVGLLVTRARVGETSWRRLQVMARWAWKPGGAEAGR